jgi:hypothetical protein
LSGKSYFLVGKRKEFFTLIEKILALKRNHNWFLFEFLSSRLGKIKDSGQSRLEKLYGVTRKNRKNKNKKIERGPY